MQRIVIQNVVKETRATFPFLGMLALLFIGLKLGSIIHWSWWLVLLPLYGPLAAVIGIFLTIVLVLLLIAGVAALIRKARN